MRSQSCRAQDQAAAAAAVHKAVIVYKRWLWELKRKTHGDRHRGWSCTAHKAHMQQWTGGLGSALEALMSVERCCSQHPQQL
jgi:hypothetical protein